MLLPAAGLIIAAAPATERRRCRGRPPAVPVLAVPPFPRPPLRVTTPGCHQGSLSETPLRAEYSGRHSGSPFQANFRNSISWGPIGQGLISWWGPCPLEVPGRPKCGQGPRHKIRPCPSEPYGGAVLGTDGGRRGRNGHPGGRWRQRDGVRGRDGGEECGGDECCGEECGATKLVGQLSGCVSGEC